LPALYCRSYIEASQESRMLGRIILALLLLCCEAASAAEIVDATGRHVAIPEHVAHVLPAGPPAAVLLEAIAPDLMVGWPEPVSDAARATLPPPADTLPQIPRLTGREDVADKIKALHPDLIVDYGTVSPRYADLAKATQDKTGVATILLDGSLADIPGAITALGGILHREERAATLARFAEAILALPLPPGAQTKVLYARGEDGLTVAAPGTDVTAVFTRLGWHVLAPEGQGTFRTTTVEAIRALDPDILVFADAHMHDVLAHTPAWQAVRAVKDGHALIAPSLPFGWIEEPPSINRLAGVAWLGGSDPGTVAALFNAVVYGRVLTPQQHDAVLAGFRPSPQ
jgi:iron complex transport system substrate-binding protein